MPLRLVKVGSKLRKVKTPDRFSRLKPFLLIVVFVVDLG